MMQICIMTCKGKFVGQAIHFSAEILASELASVGLVVSGALVVSDKGYARHLRAMPGT